MSGAQPRADLRHHPLTKLGEQEMPTYVQKHSLERSAFKTYTLSLVASKFDDPDVLAKMANISGLPIVNISGLPIGNTSGLPIGNTSGLPFRNISDCPFGCFPPPRDFFVPPDSSGVDAADISGCYFNCSRPPYDLSPYPDISGIGVLVGYTATAGLVVLILVSHYLVAYDPTKDPFCKGSSCVSASSQNPRPNPIDIILFSYFPRPVSSPRLQPKHSSQARACPNWETAFIKCVKSMSDLQILTGTSILISGYVQLRCGISTFHWQIIVWLAWFSSITHLSCLTFLRNYLYNRPVERAWRLIAMGSMLLMLLVAMVPTGGYKWTGHYTFVAGPPIPAPSDYAICYLRPSKSGNKVAFSTMVISVTFLTLGFGYRVVRLHKSLSLSTIGRARNVCSEKARYCLRFLYVSMGLETPSLTLKRTLFYRPLLALFLTLRALLDFWNSMFIEVLWMLGSFTWGLCRLLQTLKIDDGSSSDWSFGQVVPIVILAAPLLTIFESFFQEKKSINTLSTALVQIHNAYLPSHRGSTPTNVLPHQRDHPDQDFYQSFPRIRSLVWLMVYYAFALVTAILIFGGGKTTLVDLIFPTKSYVSYLPIHLAFAIWIYITVSLLFEDIEHAPSDVLKSFMGISRNKQLVLGRALLIYGSIYSYLSYLLPVNYPISLIFLGFFALVYCILSLVVHFVGTCNEVEIV